MEEWDRAPTWKSRDRHATGDTLYQRLKWPATVCVHGIMQRKPAGRIWDNLEGSEGASRLRIPLGVPHEKDGMSKLWDMHDERYRRKLMWGSPRVGMVAQADSMNPAAGPPSVGEASGGALKFHGRDRRMHILNGTRNVDLQKGSAPICLLQLGHESLIDWRGPADIGLDHGACRAAHFPPTGRLPPCGMGKARSSTSHSAVPKTGDGAATVTSAAVASPPSAASSGGELQLRPRVRKDLCQMGIRRQALRRRHRPRPIWMGLRLTQFPLLIDVAHTMTPWVGGLNGTRPQTKNAAIVGLHRQVTRADSTIEETKVTRLN